MRLCNGVYDDCEGYLLDAKIHPEIDDDGDSLLNVKV